MKLKHNGRWGWGIYGLNGWSIYDLSGWGIYDLNGWGIYDLYMSGAFMAQMLVITFREICSKSTGRQESTFFDPRMTTGFGPFGLYFGLFPL